MIASLILLNSSPRPCAVHHRFADGLTTLENGDSQRLRDTMRQANGLRNVFSSCPLTCLGDRGHASRQKRVDHYTGSPSRRIRPGRGDGLPSTIFFSSRTAWLPPPPWRPPPP